MQAAINQVKRFDEAEDFGARNWGFPHRTLLILPLAMGDFKKHQELAFLMHRTGHMPKITRTVAPQVPTVAPGSSGSPSNYGFGQICGLGPPPSHAPAGWETRQANEQDRILFIGATSRPSGDGPERIGPVSTGGKTGRRLTASVRSHDAEPCRTMRSNPKI